MLMKLQEISLSPILSHDPLPPLDSVASYTRPPRYVTLVFICWCVWLTYFIWCMQLTWCSHSLADSQAVCRAGRSSSDLYTGQLLMMFAMVWVTPQLCNGAPFMREQKWLSRLHSHLGKSKPGMTAVWSSVMEVKRESKVLPEPHGPWGGTDLRFISPQPDTSLHYKTMDTGPVYRTMCLFSPQLSLVLIAPTHWGMARLSELTWVAGYTTGQI